LGHKKTKERKHPEFGSIASHRRMAITRIKEIRLKKGKKKKNIERRPCTLGEPSGEKAGKPVKKRGGGNDLEGRVGSQQRVSKGGGN